MSENHVVGEMYLSNQSDGAKRYKPGEIFFCVGQNEYLLVSENLKIREYSWNFTKLEFSDKLEGKKVCITGTLPYPRDFYKKIIEINGGEFCAGINKKLSFLIASDEFLRDEKAGYPSTKIEKAREYKINVLSFKDFLNIVK